MDESRIKAERQLFLSLLELGHESELRPVMARALSLAVEATGARQGYIELYADGDASPTWTMSQTCSEDEVVEIRSRISRGIVSEAIATGEVVHTPSALLDARFAEQTSVRQRGIESVLCAAVGADPPIGVLYLEGKSGAGPFAPQDVELVRTFGRQIAPIVSRLASAESSRVADDPTTRWRSKLRVAGLVGRSVALGRVLEQVALVAPLDVTVLLTGASGTGKTALAEAIHDNSPRRAAPLVSLNCAALPETLMESELFGAEIGSHSTATRRLAGKVAAAEGGTLFLDEVTELSPGAQAKLLQLLQSGQYHVLGSSVPANADIRVIAATNADPDELVKNKQLREDLYYRLNVIRIGLPRLSERPEDVLPLADRFRDNASRKHNRPRLSFSPYARLALTSQKWPGNVRQLAHVVEVGLLRAAAEESDQIERRHVFQDSEDDPDSPPTFHEATRVFHKQLLDEALKATGWNVMETARRLDLTRSHVYNLISAHGLARRDRD